MSLEGVRKRLEAATRGPWQHFGRIVQTKARETLARSYEMTTSWPDADLIAHAPSDLELMADVVEAAEMLRNEMIAHSHNDYISIRREHFMRLQYALNAFEAAS